LKRLKNVCGIWCLRAGQPDIPVAELTEIAVEELGWLVDGFEYHYPFEINEDNAAAIQRSLRGEKDGYAVCFGNFANPDFAKGAFINPISERRNKNIVILKQAVSLAADLGAWFEIS